MIYSAAKGNSELSLEWAKTPDVGLPRPDLVVFLDLEAEEAERRGGWGDEVYERKEMQGRVRELFLVSPAVMFMHALEERCDLETVLTIDVIGGCKEGGYYGHYQCGYVLFQCLM